jgi:hypothetical protein
MKFVRFILRCVVVLIVAVGLYALIGNDLAYFLFRTIYSGLPYPLPESIATAFAILLTLVVAAYFLFRRVLSFGKRQ